MLACEWRRDRNPPREPGKHFVVYGATGETMRVRVIEHYAYVDGLGCHMSPASAAAVRALADYEPR